MTTDSQALKAKAAELRAIADRMESLAERRKALENEEAEIAKWLESTPSEPPVRIRLRSKLRAVAPVSSEDEALFPTTQKGWIFRLLAEASMTRDELFEKLKATGKAPPSVDQLSAILSREKSAGKLTVDENYRWSVLTA